MNSVYFRFDLSQSVKAAAQALLISVAVIVYSN